MAHHNKTLPAVKAGKKRQQNEIIATPDQVSKL